jgi:hypothetical protein
VLLPASEDDIKSFEKDRSGPGPTPPYAPNWNKDELEGEWNTALFNLLIHQAGGKEDEAKIEEMKKLFFAKLGHIRIQL